MHFLILQTLKKLPDYPMALSTGELHGKKCTIVLVYMNLAYWEMLTSDERGSDSEGDFPKVT